MACLNSIFYILSIFFPNKSSSGLLYEMEERNRNANIDVILITILEIQTSIRHQIKLQIKKYFVVQLFTLCRIHISNI